MNVTQYDVAIHHVGHYTMRTSSRENDSYIVVDYPREEGSCTILWIIKLYIYIYIYISLRKTKTGLIRIINLFPSCYGYWYESIYYNFFTVMGIDMNQYITKFFPHPSTHTHTHTYIYIYICTRVSKKICNILVVSY